jgi:hypothetical protein
MTVDLLSRLLETEVIKRLRGFISIVKPLEVSSSDEYCRSGIVPDMMLQRWIPAFNSERESGISTVLNQRFWAAHADFNGMETATRFGLGDMLRHAPGSFTSSKHAVELPLR